MDQITEWLQQTFGISLAIQGKIVSSIVAVLLIALGRSLLLRLALRRIEDPRSTYRWRKTSSYIMWVLAFFFVGRIWFQGVEAISTYLGLISAGIAIALRDPLVNLAGWMFILWRRPFEVGDRIELGEVRGDVIDLRLFSFSMLEIGNWVEGDQTTGRIMQIPNGRIFSFPLANYNKGFSFIYEEVPVLITFESNWREAEALLTTIVEDEAKQLGSEAERELKLASSRYMLSRREVAPEVYISTEEAGVLMTLRYAIRPHDRRSSLDRVWRAILTSFEKHDDIDFAYPTRRNFNNAIEGKPGARATIPGQS
ncbi:mechanosensitive ion channel family protein [bacterium]|nr:mechanosensitive ion channel family protein [bacterium]